ncbi:hypothetical protein [Streptomyces galbus]|uniref:Uncharacterized protein n=1 Tax=Streptomyces galbus TaxID=33898 RepID=A0ABX1IKQ7_STRGB|nr:hypothetical protein [Streptomyces galbus]NKQ26221.1 hypothetical protein [Streptomyces galbus]
MFHRFALLFAVSMSALATAVLGVTGTQPTGTPPAATGDTTGGTTGSTARTVATPPDSAGWS